MSLAGSRSQLAAPSSENLNITSGHERKDGGESHIPAPTTIIKRASFVEVFFNNIFTIHLSFIDFYLFSYFLHPKLFQFCIKSPVKSIDKFIILFYLNLSQ